MSGVREAAEAAEPAAVAEERAGIAEVAPVGSPAASMLLLQRQAGNRAVGSLLASRGMLARDPSGAPPVSSPPAPGTRVITELTTQTIVDSNVAIALDRRTRQGADLTPGHHLSIDQIGPVAADPARGVAVTRQTVVEMGAGGGAAATMTVVPEVQVPASERAAIANAFRASGARPADAEVATSAALARVAGGATPRLALADRQFINGLARMAGVDPRTYGQYRNLAEFLHYTRGTNVITITVQGRRLEIQPVQEIRPNLPGPRGGGRPPRPPTGGAPPQGGAKTSTPPPQGGGQPTTPTPKPAPAPAPPVKFAGPKIDLPSLKANLRATGRAAAGSLFVLVLGAFLSKYTERAIKNLVDEQVKKLEPEIGDRVVKAIEADMAGGWLRTNPELDMYVYVTLDVWRTGSFEAELHDYFWDMPVVSIRSVSVSPLHYHEGAWKANQYPKGWEGPFERIGIGTMVEHAFFTSKYPLKSLIVQ